MRDLHSPPLKPTAVQNVKPVQKSQIPNNFEFPQKKNRNQIKRSFSTTSANPNLTLNFLSPNLSDQTQNFLIQSHFFPNSIRLFAEFLLFSTVSRILEIFIRIRRQMLSRSRKISSYTSSIFTKPLKIHGISSRFSISF